MEPATIIYTKENCTYCAQAKNLLNKMGKDYIEYKLDVDFTREDILNLFPHAKTFPQIIYEGEHVGGFTDLAKKLG